MKCLFTADLHGDPTSYNLLFEAAAAERPDAVMLGGDLFNAFPTSSWQQAWAELQPFFDEYFDRKIREFRENIRKDTRFFAILGNDDPRAYEQMMVDADQKGLFEYVHATARPFGDLYVAGYSYVPLSPFRLKDWEKYDVQGYMAPDALSPEDGFRTQKAERGRPTIADDLEDIAQLSPPERTVYLFHAPPYGGKLDVNYGDVHVGSRAILQFISQRHPFITLHGHIHESNIMTGSWKEKTGSTYSFLGANDSPGLTLVKFDTEKPEDAARLSISPP